MFKSIVNNMAICHITFLSKKTIELKNDHYFVIQRFRQYGFIRKFHIKPTQKIVTEWNLLANEM